MHNTGQPLRGLSLPEWAVKPQHKQRKPKLIIPYNYKKPQREQRNFGYAPSEDSDQPAYCCSLIRIFTGHILDSQGCIVYSSGQ